MKGKRVKVTKECREGKMGLILCKDGRKESRGKKGRKKNSLKNSTNNQTNLSRERRKGQQGGW